VAKPSLTQLAATMQDVIAAFPAHQALALVGGLAVSARTEPRFTRDIDFAVAVESEEHAQQIVYGMQQSGYLIEAIIEHRPTKRMATARLRRDVTAPMVDLLFAASGIEPEIAAAANAATVLKQTVRVAQVGHLIAMKLISTAEHRRRDESDLAALAKVADEAEWARAEAAVRLIAERGFARGRDLAAALAEWRERARVIRSEA
jgi:predicted nucleotidyltransferase